MEYVKRVPAGFQLGSSWVPASFKSNWLTFRVFEKWFQLGSGWVPAGFQLVSNLTYLISNLIRMVPVGFQLVSNQISLHFEPLKRVPAGFQLGSSWVPVGSKSD